MCPLEKAGRIHITQEKLPSLVDIGVILIRKAPCHVADALAATREAMASLGC